MNVLCTNEGRLGNVYMQWLFFELPGSEHVMPKNLTGTEGRRLHR